MGGTRTIIVAKTKKELRKKVSEWTRGVKAAGLSDIRMGYDPENIKKTTRGYELMVWAHS